MEELRKGHPNDKHWTETEQLAYWINAYNAFTVELILDHYPVASIRDIKEGVPFINSVWDIDFIKIEGKTYSLNDIEHRILRREFDEPRIHFAIVCASISCPKLRNEAFEAAGQVFRHSKQRNRPSIFYTIRSRTRYQRTKSPSRKYSSGLNRTSRKIKPFRSLFDLSCKPISIGILRFVIWSMTGD